MSEAEQLALLATDGMLVKRPLLVLSLIHISTTATFFLPSVSVGLPRGPTKSARQSPSFMWLSFTVVAPTV